MTLSPEIMTSVEQLGYRVTVGDVATQAGLELNVAQQGLLALASDSGGHLQVAKSGDIIYLFPQNFKTIIRNKYWKLRFKETLKKIWNALFYLIRISFGVILIASVVLMMITIGMIIVAISSNSERDRDSQESRGPGYGGNFIFLPNFSDLFWVFYPDHNYSLHRDKSYQSSEKNQQESDLNFLEAIFSFLFGEGNPNYDLEESRWREIGSVIRNNKGAIIAQQISPYLDKITQYDEDSEDYMLPILTRFNGYPKVSPQGEIIYYFPELQVTAQLHKKRLVTSYLKEKSYYFSRASSRQIMLAIGLGVLNFILALVLGYLIKDPKLINQMTGLVSFASSIYWILLVYAIAFLGIPLIRHFWIQWRNNRIEYRNMIRQKRAENLLQPNESLQQKIKYACEFAAEKLITEADISYTTEKDVLEQEFER
ncbi:MAG: hypothetical protein ACTMUB_09335 [cyanobacterium endosymbiont of Rhopalodia musculus]|uniref:hypothetical protein n=1 Tax=cyanobacterium endosymbiont of Epithemia clementina EcSB TaxID=3034674 RepID=UPI0024806128|nr:hypothetical protein [cyanobacterium endosymbiont of Epithemia clementina EcSB]WGT68254.1 hypothetical protein P3F56_04120 [cyanobacterium endosymbiont of Epithemia clementina EcSB]